MAHPSVRMLFRPVLAKHADFALRMLESLAATYEDWVYNSHLRKQL